MDLVLDIPLTFRLCINLHKISFSNPLDYTGLTQPILRAQGIYLSVMSCLEELPSCRVGQEFEFGWGQGDSDGVGEIMVQQVREEGEDGRFTLTGGQDNICV